MSAGVAFQAGVAGRLDDISATMRQTHDALLEGWGKRRRSGISWWVFGGPLSAVFASSHSHVRSTAAKPNGTLDEGWALLAEMLDGGELEVEAGYLEDMQRWAAGEANPTLIIAFCDIRPPRSGHPLQSRNQPTPPGATNG